MYCILTPMILQPPVIQHLSYLLLYPTCVTQL